MTTISFGPEQLPLSRERVEEILTWKPRRMVIGGRDWPNVLYTPRHAGADWSMVLPFCETLENAFNHGCDADTIGFRMTKGRCWTFLRDTADLARADLQHVLDWIAVVGKYVALRDGLCLSFALNYDRHEGDPHQEQTEVGQLRSRAKTYGGPSTRLSRAAADELTNRLNGFLDEMRCYQGINALVAMPPSSLDKPFDLPSYIVNQLSIRRNLPNLSDSLVTIGRRPQMKDVELGRKVELLDSTIEASSGVSGRNVLLIDDLYQSGASANVAAKHLLAAGARRVYGLFCEKTCRNDDNAP